MPCWQPWTDASMRRNASSKSLHGCVIAFSMRKKLVASRSNADESNRKREQTMGTIMVGFDRTVGLERADAALRQRLSNSLSGLRWQVREARGGAEAIAQLEDQPTEALLLDHWLPDLEVVEFAEQIGAMYPGVDLLRIDGDPVAGGTKSPRRHELLHALREAL